MAVELDRFGETGVLIGELEELRDAIRMAAEPLSEGEFWTKPLEPGNSVRPPGARST